MADENLNLKIVAQVDQAQAALKQVADSLRSVQTETAKVGTEGARGLTQAEQGATKLAEGAKIAKTELTGLAGLMEQASRAASGVGTAMEFAGVESAGAAQKLRLMNVAISELAAAAGPMLLLVAAFELASKAFESLKEGITEGGKIAEQVGQISNSVKNMGGDFQKAGVATREWAEQLAGETGQSVTALIGTVQKMTAAHIDYRTAMQLSRDAELMSIASGRDYESVADALLAAVNGRTRALVQMGIITKEEAKNGISLVEVNNRIVESTKGAVEAYQHSLPGAFATTGAQIKALIVDLADKSGISGAIVEMLNAVKAAIPYIKALAEEGFAKLHALGAALHPLIAALAPVFDGLQGPVSGLMQSIGHLSDSLIKIVGEISTLVAPMFRMLGEQIGMTFRDIFNIIKLALDSIIVIVDVFVDITSGDWSKLQKDLWVIADDGLKALDGLFGGYLANILAGIDAFCNMTRDKLSNALSFASNIGSKIALTQAGLPTDAVPDPKYIPDKGFGSYYQDSLKDVNTRMAFTAHMAAIPGGSHTHHETGGASGAGIIKDKELGGGGHGAKGGKGGGGVVSGTIYGPLKDETDEVVKAQKALEAVLETNNASLMKFKTTVADSTTELGRIRAEDALTAQHVAVLAANNTTLNDAMDKGSTKLFELNAQRQKDVAALDKASAAHDKLQNAMLANNGGTDDQKVKLQDLTTAHDTAKKAFDETNKKIKEQSADLEKNSKALVANQDALNAIHKALADVQVAWDTFSAKMMRDDKEHSDTLGMTHKQLAKYYNEQYKEDFANFQAALVAKNAAMAKYYEGLAQQDLTHVHAEDRIMEDATKKHDEWLKKQSEKYKEDLATWQLTNAAKVVFYKAALDQMGALTADNAEKRMAIEQALLAASISAIQDQKKAHEALMQSETTYVEAFFQDATDKTKGFSAFFKTIWTDLKNHVIKQLSEMIVQSTLFQKVFGSPGGNGQAGSGILGFLGGDNKAGQKDANVEQFKVATDSFRATTNGFQTSINTHQQVTNVFQQSTNTYQTATGTFQGSTGDFGTAVSQFSSAVARMGSGGGLGGGSGLPDFFQNGIPGFNGGTFDVPGAGALPGLDAFTGPNLMPNVLDMNLSSIGGSSLTSSVDGLLPTKVSGVSSGAANALSGAMMGLGIGSMVAGMTGGNSTWGSVGGAIGGAFFGPVGAAVGGALGGLVGPHWGPPSNYPDRSDSTYTPWLNAFNSGAGGIGDKTQNLLDKLDPTKLTGSALDDYNRLKAIEAQSGGQLGISNEHDGIFTINHGAQVSVTDYRALIDRFNNETQNAAANSPVFQVDRFAPDFNTGKVSSWQSAAANATSTTGGMITAPNGGNIVDPPITININGGSAETNRQLAQIIAEEIARNRYYGGRQNSLI